MPNSIFGATRKQDTVSLLHQATVKFISTIILFQSSQTEDELAKK